MSYTLRIIGSSSADVSRVASESVDVSSDGDDEGRGEGDRGQLRRDVMLGRMVQLLGEDAGGPLPPASLPLLAEQLQAAGLLPRWVAACLAHKPALFDKTFTLLFKEVGWVVTAPWLLRIAVCAQEMEHAQRVVQAGSSPQSLLAHLWGVEGAALGLARPGLPTVQQRGQQAMPGTRTVWASWVA